jgi:hypothetical protein
MSNLKVIFLKGALPPIPQIFLNFKDCINLCIAQGLTFLRACRLQFQVVVSLCPHRQFMDFVISPAVCKIGNLKNPQSWCLSLEFDVYGLKGHEQLLVP